MNERELSLIKIIGAAIGDQLKTLEAKNAERFKSLEETFLKLSEGLDGLQNKCASISSEISEMAIATDRKITGAIKAAFETMEPPELPDVASMVKDAVAAIELPQAPELPDVASMVKEAVAAIELPAAPELPDVASMVKDAVAAIELPAAPELPDVARMVKDAVAAIELPAAPELPDVASMVKEAVAAIELPQAPELPDVASIVKEAVATTVKDAVAAIELPAAPELPDVASMVKAAVDAIELPEAPELPDVTGLIAEGIADAMGAIEMPKAPELPDISAMVAEAVAAVEIPQPQPVDLDAVAEKAAALIPAPMAPELPDVAAMVKAAVAEIPAPVDGKPGADGKDAAALEILPEIDTTKSYKRGTWATHAGGLWRTFEKSHGMRGWECVVNGQSNTAIKCSDDMRTITIAVTQSDGRIQEKHFDIPTVIYRELYKAGNVYAPGDAVTWGGSLWICTEKTADKPGDPESQGWRLAVKKGRDAK